MELEQRAPLKAGLQVEAANDAPTKLKQDQVRSEWQQSSTSFNQYAYRINADGFPIFSNYINDSSSLISLYKKHWEL